MKRADPHARDRWSGAARPRKRPTQHRLDAALAMPGGEGASRLSDRRRRIPRGLRLFQGPGSSSTSLRLSPRGDDANALVLRSYLELDPGAALRRRARLLITAPVDRREARCRAQGRRGSQRQAAADAQHTISTSRKEATDGRAAHHSTQGNRRRRCATRYRCRTGRAIRRRPRSFAGLASVGRCIGLGVGVAFGCGALHPREASHWTTYDPHRYDQGRAAERRMFAFTAIGSAALIAGGVLCYAPGARDDFLRSTAPRSRSPRRSV
jgi:hypothetical protein